MKRHLLALSCCASLTTSLAPAVTTTPATSSRVALRAPALLTAPAPALDALVGPARRRLAWNALRDGRDPCGAETPELSKAARAALEDAFAGPAQAATRQDAKTAADGTTKLLVDVGGGAAVESVLIPQRTRGKPTTTLCVSTQVGCAMGCAFCATGKMGLSRSLVATEIAEQF